MEAIQVEHLARTFSTYTGVIVRKRKEIEALKDVSFTIENGELFGLLGPNGAGKTTITKILATILLPTAGTAKVIGFDVVRQYNQIRPRIGIVFGGERGIYWRLSGKDNLQYFADLYGVPPAISRQRIPELLELVGLDDRANERVEGYSRGMKQRLHIARGLINNPEILFLDEPTIGLDPVAARELRLVIRDLNEAGKTIFLTSHYMYEIDVLCDRVAVVNQGSIITVDTPSALKKFVADLEVVEIECLGLLNGQIQSLRDHRRVDNVNVTSRDQIQIIQIQAQAASELVQEFLNLLEGTRIQKVVTRQPTLEDAYVKLVGKEALKV
jgi:ABC-2 type transport system ATP-binding protein